MADSFTPSIAPQTDGSGSAPEQAQQQPDATEPPPITEQEVGEYREQDRYLPVSPPTTPSPLSLLIERAHGCRVFLWILFISVRVLAAAPFPPKKKDCKCLAYHEERRAANG